MDAMQQQLVAAQADVDSVRAALQAAERSGGDAATLAAEVSTLRGELQHAQRQATAAGARCKELEKSAEAAAARAQQAGDALAQRDEQLAEQDGTLSQLKQLLQDVQADSKQQLAEAKQRVDELDNKLQAQADDTSALDVVRVEALIAEVEQLKAATRRLQDELQQTAQARDRAEAKAQSSQAEVCGCVLQCVFRVQSGGSPRCVVTAAAD